MRHFYFRLIFGIVWLAAAVVSVVKAKMSFFCRPVCGVRQCMPVVRLFNPEKGERR